MTPSQLLFTEHVAILKALVIAEQATEKLELGTDLGKEFWTNLVIFLKGFADECHHANEEQFFLPQMRRQNEEFSKMTIRILEEHVKGRQFIKDLEEALKQYFSGEKFAKNLMINAIRNYIVLLRPHIVLENINFPKAQNKFSKETIDKMSQEFKKPDKKYSVILKKLTKAND